MTSIATVCQSLEHSAPLELAEDWDNVGLLVGDPKLPAKLVLVCLTLTPKVVEEAIEKQASLVVTHHPLPFRPLQKITTATIEGNSLWRLIGNKIAVYSAHTAYDSAALGVNQQIAEGLGLANPVPFISSEELQRTDGAGTGRIGSCPANQSLASLATRAKTLFELPTIRYVGNEDKPAKKVAIACGSGGSLMDHAIAAGCDTFLTGEATFHDCLKAESHGIGLLLTGHYASERFAMERLATHLATEFEDLTILPSDAEQDPIKLI